MALLFWPWVEAFLASYSYPSAETEHAIQHPSHTGWMQKYSTGFFCSFVKMIENKFDNVSEIDSEAPHLNIDTSILSNILMHTQLPPNCQH